MGIDIRQKFHLEPDVGLLNDPNGLIQYKGIYYVFFQWNRFEKNHTYKEWGLFTKCERKAPKFIYGDISSLKNNDSISLFFIVLYF